jgi:hypothetical protein
MQRASQFLKSIVVLIEPFTILKAEISLLLNITYYAQISFIGCCNKYLIEFREHPAILSIRFYCRKTSSVKTGSPALVLYLSFK